MEYGTLSHKGNVRQLNEDSCFVLKKDDLNFAIVADGMGGHNAGEVASKIAIEVVAKRLSGNTTVSPYQIREAINNANKDVFDYATANQECIGMGTTLVMAVFERDSVIVANVGDSRAYYFNAASRALSRITKDHSLVEELLSTGKLTNEQAEYYPFRNVITRAIGTAGDIKVDMFDVDWAPGDFVLLCSDGLTLHVEDEMLKGMIDPDEMPQKICDEMVHLALERGGRDNVTVVVVKNTAGGESN